MIADVVNNKLYIFCEGPFKEVEKQKMYKFLKVLNSGNTILDVGILQIQSEDQEILDPSIADRIGISLEAINYGNSQ